MFVDEWGSTDGEYVSVRCQGRGTRSGGRFTSFRCPAVWQADKRVPPVSAVLWMKVRRQGAGQPCVSLTGLAAIPAQCLNPAGVRARGSTREAWTAARRAIGRRLGQAIYFGPGSCAGHGAGFYACSFGSNDPAAATNGHATVTFLRSGTRAAVLSMPG